MYRKADNFSAYLQPSTPSRVVIQDPLIEECLSPVYKQVTPFNHCESTLESAADLEGYNSVLRSNDDTYTELTMLKQKLESLQVKVLKSEVQTELAKRELNKKLDEVQMCHEYIETHIAVVRAEGESELQQMNTKE